MSTFRKASRERRFAEARATNPALFDRLMSHTIVKGPEDCWITDLAKNGGYSCLKVNKVGIKSHRLMYGFFHPGENPPEVRHMCHNPSCVNPLHLRGGTHKENMEDRESANRGADRHGEKNGRAKLTPVQVLAIRASGENGPTLSAIYGVTKEMISRIRIGKAWTHI